jgi:AraC-like DNA-binding protein
VTQRVIDYIELNYADQISLRHVAQAVGYSVCHLATTFRRSTGTPVTAWNIKRRIVAAQKLLAEGNIDVATVCEAVGFSDLCYFIRQFVRQVGITPGRFRVGINAARAGRLQATTCLVQQNVRRSGVLTSYLRMLATSGLLSNTANAKVAQNRSSRIKRNTGPVAPRLDRSANTTRLQRQWCKLGHSTTMADRRVVRRS